MEEKRKKIYVSSIFTVFTAVRHCSCLEVSLCLVIETQSTQKLMEDNQALDQVARQRCILENTAISSALPPLRFLDLAQFFSIAELSPEDERDLILLPHSAFNPVRQVNG